MSAVHVEVGVALQRSDYRHVIWAASAQDSFDIFGPEAFIFIDGEAGEVLGPPCPSSVQVCIQASYVSKGRHMPGFRLYECGSQG